MNYICYINKYIHSAASGHVQSARVGPHNYVWFLQEDHGPTRMLASCEVLWNQRTECGRWRPRNWSAKLSTKLGHGRYPKQVDVLVEEQVTSEANWPAIVVTQQAGSRVEQNGLVVAINRSAADVDDTGHNLELSPSHGAVVVSIENRQVDAVPFPGDGLTMSMVQPRMAFQLQANPGAGCSQTVQKWSLVMPLLDGFLQRRGNLRQVSKHNDTIRKPLSSMVVNKRESHVCIVRKPPGISFFSNIWALIQLANSPASCCAVEAWEVNQSASILPKIESWHGLWASPACVVNMLKIGCVHAPQVSSSSEVVKSVVHTWASKVLFR